MMNAKYLVRGNAKMDEIVVDFSNAKSVWDVHSCFIDPFGLETDFGPYMTTYARNWNALWDLLWGIFNEPTLVILKGMNTWPPALAGIQEEVIKFFEELKTHSLEKLDGNVDYIVADV